MANSGRTLYDPSRLATYQGWAREGLIDLEIAKKLGISRQTIANWKKKYPEFAEALREGKEDADFRVENALYDKAIAGPGPFLLGNYWEGSNNANCGYKG